MGNENLFYLHDLFWEEVFGIWQDNEAWDPNWVRLALSRGYRSWAHWRLKGYAYPFECPKAKWALYQINNPLELVPNFYAGPYRTWIKMWYRGKTRRPFSYLARLPGIQVNPKIKSMVENYPSEAILLGLRLKSGKIVIIDGTQRGCALAIMALRKIVFKDPVLLALGESDRDDLPVVGQNTLRPKK